MRAKFVITLSLLILLFSCKYSNHSNTETQKDYESFIVEIEENINSEDYNRALDVFKLAAEKQIIKPMEITSNPRLRGLIDQEDERSKVRRLLEASAYESKAKMIRDDEAGESIIIEGRVLNSNDGSALENVNINLVQTDSEGHYFKENSMWNPRLFAYLKSDDEGRFAVETIMPGRYDDDEGNIVAAHVHFNIKKENYRDYNSEFSFEDDSIIINNGNIESLPLAIVTNKSGIKKYYIELSIDPI